MDSPASILTSATTVPRLRVSPSTDRRVGRSPRGEIGERAEDGAMAADGTVNLLGWSGAKM